jgi:hypothetical protein
MGPGGPVDINHHAIHEAMDLYDIKDKRECFERVLIMANEQMRLIREKLA